MTARPLPRNAGVTLVEILIAVSLLSLLSVGVLIAMRIGFNTMDKVDTRLVSNRRVSYSHRILENELAGYITTTAEWHPRPTLLRRVAFHQWEPQTMRFVTAYSLQDAWRGRPQITVFQVIPGEQGRGVRLIVNETPYVNEQQAGEMISEIDTDGTIHFAPAVVGAGSFVLADKLAYCRFAYLEPETVPPFQQWRPDWIRPQQLPQGIRIDMAPLDATSADLHVSGVTVPFHINRDLNAIYADTP